MKYLYLTSPASSKGGRPGGALCVNAIMIVYYCMLRLPLLLFRRRLCLFFFLLQS